MPLRHRIVATLFIATLWAPLAGMWLGIGQFRSDEENRRLEAFPRVGSDPRSWLEFPTQFTRYFLDHFGFRAKLIMLQSWLKVKVIGISISPQVVIGKHEWLFYAGDYSIESYRGARPFTQADLDRWVRLFERRAKWLVCRNIQSLVVIAPDKHTIYPEYMPGTIPRGQTVSRLDSLAATLGQTDVRLLDLRPALLAAKSRYSRLYYYTDSHWNGYGAYTGYRAIAAELAKLYPEIKPMPESDCVLSQAHGGGDLAHMLGIPSALAETMDYLGPRRPWHIEAGGRKLVAFIDSFGLQLEGFLRTNFASIEFTRQYEFDLGVVLDNKPDLVIFELCERRLNSDPPNDRVQMMERLDKYRGDK
jgi:alginate O-acetyltransferase complex protein AlgJ